jgi:hypothetical protein
MAIVTMKSSRIERGDVMSVHILEDKDTGECCFKCSVVEWAFGKVFPDRETAEGFLDWLKVDPRKFTDNDFESKYYEYLRLKKLESFTPSEKGEVK